MIKVVVINGYPKSGKSTFCTVAKNLFGEVEELSIVDFPKELARLIQRNLTKTLETRKLIYDLKIFLEEHGDVPFLRLTEEINRLRQKAMAKKENLVIFVNCRNPKDIERLVEKYNADTVFVQRDGYRPTLTYEDSPIIEEYGYGYYIDNNSTMENLIESCKTFMDSILV